MKKNKNRKEKKEKKHPGKLVTIDDSPYCDYDVIRTLPNIGDTQFIVCGWNILLLSNNKCFRDEFRTARSEVRKMIHKDESMNGYYFSCSPNNKKFKHFRSRIIYLCNDLTVRSILEVIVHEVSHLVDYIFEFAKIDSVDTEFRAYLNDYYCGKLFDMLDLSSAGRVPSFLEDKFKAKNEKAQNDNYADRLAQLLKENKNKIKRKGRG